MILSVCGHSIEPLTVLYTYIHDIHVYSTRALAVLVCLVPTAAAATGR